MKEIVLAAGLIALLLLVLLQKVHLSRQKSLQEKLETKEKDGIYLFTSPSCALCKTMKKAHAQAISENRIRLVDVTTEAELTSKLKILSVPTTLVIRGGRIVHSIHGFAASEVLTQWQGE